MAKKKNKKRIVYNIDKLDFDIDYDKLAEAIVKANSKQQEAYSPSREWMKYILTPIFWGVSVLSGILAIAMIVSFCQSVSVVLEKGISIGILTLSFEFFCIFFAIGFCIFSVITAKEIEKENDRTYIASLFSNIVAIAALVVALVALIKGAG